MEPWIGFVQRLLHAFNLLTIAYFFVGNGIYTVLMLISLVFALIYRRRLDYHGLDELRESGVLPPLTVIIPAHNEENSLLETIRAVRQADYPDLRLIVVDDGSTDATLNRLVSEFGLRAAPLIYRAPVPTQGVKAFFTMPDAPTLTVIRKQHGGKADALNAGVNACRTPYFCTLDADSIIEADALLRLMRPIVRSKREVVVSGGIIRVRNGCKVAGARVEEARLPRRWIERLQVVEYLRSFLFGRAGWDLLGGTMIVSGAMAIFHRQHVLDAGGFSSATVGEDMELVVRLHRRAARLNQKIAMAFSFDPVCWTECPSSFSMLARQRRRWQLGLCQTLWGNLKMFLNPRFGVLGMVSFPFHVCIESLGAAVEFLGYLVVPVAFALHLTLSASYIALVILCLLYASFLSVGAVLLEELAYRRYPRRRDLYVLIVAAMIDNFGYRQLILCYRVQGFVRFICGVHQWEKVAHTSEACG